MLEKIFILFVVAGCAFFIGRRFYRQWRSAALGDAIPCCSDGCSSCRSSSSCESKTTSPDQRK
ncbi:MAG: FeoB-associated Cys-rich membrane protein [Deltaproteobacteria bacterium]|nr:FeoB-associated Cys-rich membrane protein [Deltaproteobacteria bacterium]MBW2658143.1 FeoB-associated Cys-rich membrane protein [Deltaproteobacteria bacterium]